MKLYQIAQYTTKQIDKSKITKALDSFFDKFQVQDLMGGAKELEDLLLVAHFNEPERLHFLAKVHDRLKAQGVTLDVLRDFD